VCKPRSGLQIPGRTINFFKGWSFEHQQDQQLWRPGTGLQIPGNQFEKRLVFWAHQAQQLSSSWLTCKSAAGQQIPGRKIKFQKDWESTGPAAVKARGWTTNSR